MSTQTSVDWLAHHERTRPNKLAILDVVGGRNLTYAEMNDRTSRLASALARDFGVRPGDRVAVLSKNVSNIFEVQFACWKLGAVFVPLNWRLAVPELAYIVGDCAPVVMLHGGEFAPQAAQLQVAHRIAWDRGGNLYAWR